MFSKQGNDWTVVRRMKFVIFGVKWALHHGRTALAPHAWRDTDLLTTLGTEVDAQRLELPYGRFDESSC